MEIVVNKKEARNFANYFTREFIKKYLAQEKNLFLLFEGQLGAGKTQVIKWIAKNLGIKETIQSPTFTLWKIYDFRIKNKKYKFNHIDLYRLKNPKDIFKLPLNQELKQPNNLFLIEWGKRIVNALPSRHIEFKIKIIGKNQRKITVA